MAALENWWSVAWPVASGLLVALLATWVVYRFQRREEREGVLSALIAELELHESWVGRGGYPRGMWAGYSEGWWKGKPGETDTLVFKLSTGATDGAIQVGPSLFINRGLVRALVNYRQRAHQLNQLIDDMAVFRATSELWLPAADDERSESQLEGLRNRLDGLARGVHEGGTGDDTGDGANHHYHELRRALRAERTSSCWRRWLWFWLGLSRRAKDEPEPTW
jgi:hypothetical protein